MPTLCRRPTTPGRHTQALARDMFDLYALTQLPRPPTTAASKTRNFRLSPLSPFLLDFWGHNLAHDVYTKFPGISLSCISLSCISLSYEARTCCPNCAVPELVPTCATIFCDMLSLTRFLSHISPLSLARTTKGGAFDASSISLSWDEDDEDDDDPEWMLDSASYKPK